MSRLFAPDHARTGWPPGVPYIIGNEGCERFSFYGMKAILYEHTAALYVATGVAGDRAQGLATSDVHLFIFGVYALPMIGASLADRWLGKYRTILWLSLVYCAGHAVLAAAEGSLAGMHLGLGLIAIGSGGIKPCVSANVGDQFGKGNWHLLPRVFQAFYFIINFGSFFATLSIPLLRKHLGPAFAFGLPGALMFLATFVFWLGRDRFVHVPASPGGRLGVYDALTASLLFLVPGSLFFTAGQPLWIVLGASGGCAALGLLLFAHRQRLVPEGSFLAVALAVLRTRSLAAAEARYGPSSIDAARAVVRVMSVFIVCLFFWACFDQKATSWIRQASLMERTVTLPLVGTLEILPSQTGAANPFFVLCFIPLLSSWIFPALEARGLAVTPLRRMTVGMFVGALSFVAVALLQARVDAALAAGHRLHVAWQLVPHAIMTLGEVLVSATALEFAYSQAPASVKSTLMAFWNLTVALGDLLTGTIARRFDLPLGQFLWLFAGLLGAAAVVFAVRARFYVYRDRIIE